LSEVSNHTTDSGSQDLVGLGDSVLLEGE